MYGMSDKGRYGDIKGTLGQRERMKDARHDVYKERRKLEEPTRCPRCGSVFTNGRWSWDVVSGVTKEATCPACRRIQDDYPAGYVELSGEFFQSHQQDILNLIENVETAEKMEHPTERVIAVRRDGDTTIVTTTGIHLARRMGDALKRAYKGDLELQYGESDDHLRVFWSR